MAIKTSKPSATRIGNRSLLLKNILRIKRKARTKSMENKIREKVLFGLEATLPIKEE